MDQGNPSTAMAIGFTIHNRLLISFPFEDDFLGLSHQWIGSIYTSLLKNPIIAEVQMLGPSSSQSPKEFKQIPNKSIQYKSPKDGKIWYTKTVENGFPYHF